MKKGEIRPKKKKFLFVPVTHSSGINSIYGKVASVWQVDRCPWQQGKLKDQRFVSVVIKQCPELVKLFHLISHTVVLKHPGVNRNKMISSWNYENKRMSLELPIACGQDLLSLCTLPSVQWTMNEGRQAEGVLSNSKANKKEDVHFYFQTGRCVCSRTRICVLVCTCEVNTINVWGQQNACQPGVPRDRVINFKLLLFFLTPHFRRRLENSSHLIPGLLKEQH